MFLMISNFFLANEIELTIGHYDWSKRLFKGSTFVHLKKMKFQKISLNCFLFKKKRLISKKDFSKLHFSKLFFRTTSGPNPL